LNDTLGATAPLPLDDRKRWIGLAVMLAGAFMSIMDVFIVNIAIPSIRADLGASFAEIELVVAGYSLAYAVALITGGRLGDLYGRRRIFVIGLASFTGASVLCGIAPTPTALVLARLLQGIAAAVMFPQVFSLIRVTFPEDRERAIAFGCLGATLGLSSIMGQLVGGLLVEADLWGLAWRPVFLVNLPIGVLAIVAAPRFIMESRSATARRLDWAGVALSAIALSLLLYPLIEGREAGWPLWSIAMLAASAPALAAFGIHQHRKSKRADSPLLEMRLFHDRAFVIGVLMVLVFYSTLNSFYVTLAFLLQSGLGATPLQAALIYTPSAIGFLAASLVAGRIGVKTGRAVLIAGAAVSAAGAALIGGVVWWQAGALEGVDLILPMIVQSIGNGLLMTPLLNVILGSSHADDAGSAAGVVSTMQQVGGAIGIAIIGILFFGTLESARLAGEASQIAYGQAFVTSIVYNVAATLVTLALLIALPRRPGSARSTA
jgi:EmrB/QacA subfamily drug resistance transporter